MRSRRTSNRKPPSWKPRPRTRTDRTPEQATFLEHVFEIRTRLIRSLVMFLGSSAVCYLRSRELFDFLANPAEGHLVFTHPVDGMMAYIKLALICGLLVSSPFILYQVYAFFKPALSPKQRRGVPLGIAAAYALFIVGVYFSLQTLPLTMRFLMSYSRPDFRAMIAVDQYFGFVFLITLGGGLAFQMPLLMYLFAVMGFVSSPTLVKHWRIAIMVCLILGAMICPTPDVITWAIVCLPLFGLYGLSILVVRWVEGRKNLVKLN
ncbi:MAG: twin-arginine translocase subunit TatC [bacterium]